MNFNKSIKKVAAMLLSFAILISSVCFSAFAYNPDFSLSASSVTVTEGDSFKISVTLTNISGFNQQAYKNKNYGWIECSTGNCVQKTNEAINGYTTTFTFTVPNEEWLDYNTTDKINFHISKGSNKNPETKSVTVNIKAKVEATTRKSNSKSTTKKKVTTTRKRTSSSSNSKATTKKSVTKKKVTTTKSKSKTTTKVTTTKRVATTTKSKNEKTTVSTTAPARIIKGDKTAKHSILSSIFNKDSDNKADLKSEISNFSVEMDNGRISMTWNKNVEMDGYEVACSNNNSKYIDIYDGTNNSFSRRMYNTNYQYYYKVRGYKKDGNKKLYTEYTSFYIVQT